MKRPLLTCHPEAGAARRGTSQALNRFRELDGHSVIGRPAFGDSLDFQLRDPSARYASLGMTTVQSEPVTRL